MADGAVAAGVETVMAEMIRTETVTVETVKAVM